MGRPAVSARPYDRTVVDTLVSGQEVRGHILSPDAWEATRQLARLGYSDGQIAIVVKRTRRQVSRIRNAFDIPAPLAGGGHSYLPVKAPSLPREAY